jgi:hypothetical protein
VSKSNRINLTESRHQHFTHFVYHKFNNFYFLITQQYNSGLLQPELTVRRVSILHLLECLINNSESI